MHLLRQGSESRNRPVLKAQGSAAVAGAYVVPSVISNIVTTITERKSSVTKNSHIDVNPNDMLVPHIRTA